jgi:uncharacterized small protein (DUF1192 family)
MIDPNSSDWSDLDLLTFAEVNERLANEISALESELARLGQATPAADTVAARPAQALQDRLNALRKRLAQSHS